MLLSIIVELTWRREVAKIEGGDFEPLKELGLRGKFVPSLNSFQALSIHFFHYFLFSCISRETCMMFDFLIFSSNLY